MANKALKSALVTALMIVGLALATTTPSFALSTSCFNNKEVLGVIMEKNSLYIKDSLTLTIENKADVASIIVALIEKFGPPPEPFGDMTKIGVVIFNPTRSFLVFYSDDGCSYERSLTLSAEDFLGILKALGLYDKYLGLFVKIEDFYHNLGGKEGTY